jgi:hypothetical protein
MAACNRWHIEVIYFVFHKQTMVSLSSHVLYVVLAQRRTIMDKHGEKPDPSEGDGQVTPETPISPEPGPGKHGKPNDDTKDDT